MIVHALWHFWGFKPGEVLNTEDHHGKACGVFVSEERAIAAIGRYAELEGYRDHPDGYRVFAFEVDRTYWADGFLPNFDGGDLAVAADGSPVFGNDAEVWRNQDDTDRDFENEHRYVDNEALFEPGRQLWTLEHYKIGHLNSEAFEDMGHKFLGYYSTRSRVAAAIGHLRLTPGFGEWPDGFRVRRETLDYVGDPSGFVTVWYVREA